MVVTLQLNIIYLLDQFTRVIARRVLLEGQLCSQQKSNVTPLYQIKRFGETPARGQTRRGAKSSSLSSNLMGLTLQFIVKKYTNLALTVQDTQLKCCNHETSNNENYHQTSCQGCTRQSKTFSTMDNWTVLKLSDIGIV